MMVKRSLQISRIPLPLEEDAERTSLAFLDLVGFLLDSTGTPPISPARSFAGMKQAIHARHLGRRIGVRSFIRRTPPALEVAMPDGNVCAVATTFALCGFAFLPLNASTASSPVRNSV